MVSTSVRPAPLPAVIAAITCPDCNAQATERDLRHEKTCPLGLAIDERCADDRRFFEAHPFATDYRRAPHWSEIAELKMWGLLPDVDGEAVGRVLVRQLAPGVRARSYGDIAITPCEVPLDAVAADCSSLDRPQGMTNYGGGRRVAEDIDDLIKWVKSQGWRVERDEQGYRRFFAPDGTYVVRYPATPSNKRRRFLAVVAAVRRHGITWPRPSKKEQRSQRGKETS